MRIRLRVRLRPDAHPDDREFVLDALRIGRAPSADLVVQDDVSQTVSWQHARVDMTPDGPMLSDLKSTNGTFLNGRRVETAERLRPGDTIRFGHAGPTLEIVLVDAYDRPAAPPPPMPRQERSYDPPPYQRERPAIPPAVARASSTRPAPMSATRALLVGMQKKQRVWMFVAGGCALVAAVTVALVLWRHEKRLDNVDEEIAKINAKFLDQDTDADSVDANKDGIDRGTNDQYGQTRSLDDKVKSGRAKGEVIYQRTVLSTAWVISDQMEGTGSVIEHEGKYLIITSYHVINGAHKIGVIFPKFLNGKVLANHSQYIRDGVGGSDSIPCNVWASDPGVDLAVLQATGMPEAIRPLTLAATSASPGEEVHTIGGDPSGTNALWSYSQGSVRQVAGPVELLFRSGQKVVATIVETQNPINHGDSGGPLVNRRCELVGVTAGAADTANLVARFIDISHVKEILRTRPRKSLKQDEAPIRPPDGPPVKPPPGPKSPRPKTPVVPPKTPVRPSASAGHVQVLMLIDDTDDIRPNGKRGIADGVRADERLMRSLLENGLPQGRLTIETLKGRQCRPNVVRDFFRRLHVKPEDTLMCYYAGHGCVERGTEAHYLSMNAGGNMGTPSMDMARGEVRQLMKAAGARLTVLITDCCSSEFTLPPWAPKNTAEFARGSYMVPLLLKNHGYVDIQAASPKEYGFCYTSPREVAGGIFTRNFCRTCESGNNGDWERVYSVTRDRTVADSRPCVQHNTEAIKIGQKAQTPFRFRDMNARRD